MKSLSVEQIKETNKEIRARVCLIIFYALRMFIEEKKESQERFSEVLE